MKSIACEFKCILSSDSISGDCKPGLDRELTAMLITIHQQQFADLIPHFMNQSTTFEICGNVSEH
jgi:hypothetical protein